MKPTESVFKCGSRIWIKQDFTDRCLQYMKNYLKESRYLKDRQSATEATDRSRRLSEAALEKMPRRQRRSLFRSFTVARFEAKKNRSRTRLSEKEPEAAREDQTDLIPAGAPCTKQTTTTTSDNSSDNVGNGNPVAKCSSANASISSPTNSPEHDGQDCNHHCLQHHAVPGEALSVFALAGRQIANRKRILQKLGMAAETGKELNFL